MVKVDLVPCTQTLVPSLSQVSTLEYFVEYHDNAFMADLYPSIAQTAVVVTALKVLLFPA